MRNFVSQLGHCAQASNINFAPAGALSFARVNSILSAWWSA
ncbi:MAG: hypothetical protein V1701_11470 [Planctomycetota bacterium]